jgi:hypothetical protein
MARQLGIWFYRTFDDHRFKAGSFQPPREFEMCQMDGHPNEGGPMQ